MPARSGNESAAVDPDWWRQVAPLAMDLDAAVLGLVRAFRAQSTVNMADDAVGKATWALLEAWDAYVRAPGPSIADLPGMQEAARLRVVLRELADQKEQLLEMNRQLHAQKENPVPMLLWCPGCNARHHDVGEFATKPHHTHACQSCGMVWRPAIGPTIGVQYLPGLKNA